MRRPIEAALPLCAAALVHCAITGASEPPQYRYALFDLGDLGGEASNAFGINDHGDVVGAGFLPGNILYRAVIYHEDGAITDLGTLGGPVSTTQDITNNGAVVGWSEIPSGENHAYVWQAGVMTDLGTLGGAVSLGMGANERGHVAGVADPSDDWHKAVLWEDSKIQDLGSFIWGSFALDVNEAGQIVGWSEVDTGQVTTAVLWSDGEMIDLGGLDGPRRSEARAINDLEQIVGWCFDDGGDTRACAWINRQAIDLHVHSGLAWSIAQGINNIGQVVGFGETYQNDDYGLLWEWGSPAQRLDDLVPPRTRLRIDLAVDINEHGQIAARAFEAKDRWFRALLLTPVDPEMTLSDPVPGTVGAMNTWTITGAQPGAKLHFAYSTSGGGTVVPGCDKLDAVVQLKKPKVVKTVSADVNGDATVSLFVPPAASGAGLILFQAVDVKNCEESQLTTFDFP